MLSSIPYTLSHQDQWITRNNNIESCVKTLTFHQRNSVLLSRKVNDQKQLIVFPINSRYFQYATNYPQTSFSYYKTIQDLTKNHFSRYQSIINSPTESLNKTSLFDKGTTIDEYSLSDNALKEISRISSEEPVTEELLPTMIPKPIAMGFDLFQYLEQHDLLLK